MLRHLLSIQDKRLLPKQLLFELHAEHAHPQAVPVSVVRGKNKTAVQALFLGLHDLGYRLISKEVNHGDCACAEFSMLLI